MQKKKALSTITFLSISGLTMLFFVSSDDTNLQSKSEMTQYGIPESIKNLVMGSNEQYSNENGLFEKKILSSCAMANIIIGKNGIAKCDIQE